MFFFSKKQKDEAGSKEKSIIEKNELREVKDDDFVLISGAGNDGRPVTENL